MSAIPQQPITRPHRLRRLLVAAAAVAPATVFVMANVMQHGLGLSGSATWLDPAFETPAVSFVLTALILIGPVAAVLLTLSWLVPLRFTRDDDAWQVTIRVRSDPFAIGVFVVAVAVGATLLAYAATENAACILGLSSRC
jgi:hypothetical protein